MIKTALKDNYTKRMDRQSTRGTYVTVRVATLKRDFTGHIVRTKDRWSRSVIQWKPWCKGRTRGLPVMKCYNDVKRSAGFWWMRSTHEKRKLRRMRKAYDQYGVYEGRSDKYTDIIDWR